MAQMERSGRKEAAGTGCGRGHHPAASYIRLAQFKSERRFLERWEEWSPYVEWIAAKDVELPVTDTESLLDNVEDVELLRLLSAEDKLTMQIAFFKMQGFSTEEICQQLGITPYSCYNRIKRFKQKLKKFFESD